MDSGLHFISGLPRSGSTLLAAILRQNPKIHASMSSPVAALFQELLTAMGAQHDYSVLINEEQRRTILHGLFEGYYKDILHQQIVFDTNRYWCSRMGAIAELFPQARVIACVRDLAWIMDSFERLLRKNALLMSRMFKPAESTSVYTRVDALAGPSGPVRVAWSALREAFYGEHADRLVVIDYEDLAREPNRTIEFIYDECRLPRFNHDFDNVSYEDGQAFDIQFGMPGLHSVSGKVRYSERRSVLPPDLFQRFADKSFWRTAHPANSNMPPPVSASMRMCGLRLPVSSSCQACRACGAETPPPRHRGGFGSRKARAGLPAAAPASLVPGRRDGVLQRRVVRRLRDTRRIEAGIAGGIGCHGLDQLVDLGVQHAAARRDDFLQLRARIGAIPAGNGRLILRSHDLDEKVAAALLQPDLIRRHAGTDVELTPGTGSACGIDHAILTAAPADFVGIDTTIADKRVVPGSAVENIVPGVAGQRVSENGAFEVLDVGEDVTLRIAPGVGCAGHQARRHAGGRIEVRGRVAAGAAIDRIRAALAPEPIVAGIAGERVVEGGAFEVLDVGEDVALRVAPGVGCAGHQAHRHAGRGIEVRGRVVAGAAVDRVRARFTEEPVVTGIAGERVVEGGAFEVLDIGEDVALRVAPGVGRAGHQAHVYSGCRVEVRHRVVAGAAVDRIGAALAGEPVAVGIAGQRVVEGGAFEVLDAAEHVALGLASGVGGAGHEAHVYACCRVEVRRGVESGASVDIIRTGATFEVVVAGKPVQGVVAAEAEQRVLLIGPRQRIGEVGAIQRRA